MNVLIIGDTHFPGQHDLYLQHVAETADYYSIDSVVHVGDVVDFHYISRHPTETDAINAKEELQQAKEELAKWSVVFPRMRICRGNHDMIPYRQAATLGIPPEFLKSLNDLLELPSTWTWHDQVIFGNTVVEHGLGSNGMYGAKRTAEKYRCNYVQGHTHSYAGVWWLDGPFDSIFGMQVGCGIDKEKYNARYGKNIFKHNVALGCGVILDADTSKNLPIYVPMQHDKGVEV